MELGEKLRQARLEAGLSQRQLCGEEITRNMLSQIEHGTARPSMKTLQYLAARLGKTVGYFLEEETVVSANQGLLLTARGQYDTGDHAAAAATLEGFRPPDPLFDREARLLWILCHLELAEQALDAGKIPFARTLLEKADREAPYCGPELRRRRLLLLGRLPGHAVSSQLPGLDGELLLRAEEALAADDPERAARLLEAAQDRTAPRWLLLRGDTWLATENYREAARCFHGAEAALPAETAARLERCYRELEDYKRAYEYACKQKKAP